MIPISVPGESDQRFCVKPISDRGVQERLLGPSMRRPVGVKSYFGWVSSYLMFSFARISGDSWLAAAAVKAERSEFILSLDGRSSKP